MASMNGGGGGSRPTTSSAPTASSSTLSFPAPLSNALSWTLSKWNASTTNIKDEDENTKYRQRYNSNGRSTASLVASERSVDSLSTSRVHQNFSSSRPTSRPSSRNRASPYAPPPLTPLRLRGHDPSTSSHLLTRSLAEEIRQLVPPRLQLYETWTLVYCLEQHGVSLTTLYEKCSAKEFKKGGFVLVVKDEAGGIFGAFVNESFRPSGGRYYGTGECFLWKASWLPIKNDQRSMADSGLGLLVPEVRSSTPASFSSAKSTSSRPGDRLKFKAFPYSGVNEYMILCDQAFLSVGGGDGKYGLWLDDIFEKGVSSTCSTFGNEPLSEESEKFNVIGIEVWSIS